MHEVAAVAGSALFAGLWQGIVLAAAVGLCLRWTPRAGASMRFAVWMAALAVVALLPLAEGLWARSPGAGAVQVDARWGMGLAGLWAVAGLARAVGLVRDGLRVRALRRGVTPLEVPAGCRALLDAGARRVAIGSSTAVERPGVVGFFAPCILLPDGLAERLTAAELEQVVLHEMEHLRRRDDWVNLLQKLSLVLFPLNPVLVWIDRRLCRERELACDEGVVRRLRAPRSYASCLARLAEEGMERRGVSLLLGAMERQSELARRVYGILRNEAPASGLERRLVAGALGLVLAGAAVGLARCPRLVAFEGAPVLAAAAPETGRQFLAAAPQRVFYGERVAPAATMVKASLPLPPVRHHRRRVKARRPDAPATRAELVTPAAYLLAQVQPASSAAVEVPVLVAYRLVRVEGGWLLVQL